MHRFIPAGAGNTEKQLIIACCIPVYPRWRGEHPDYVEGAHIHDGLSPLARGTRCRMT